MSLRDFLNTIDQRYAWSLLSVILALLFGGLAIYLGFFRDRKPELRFEIVSNTSVLDVREDLGKLEILYDGLDIKKSKQSLRVVVVRVDNPVRQPFSWAITTKGNHLVLPSQPVSCYEWNCLKLATDIDVKSAPFTH